MRTLLFALLSFARLQTALSAPPQWEVPAELRALDSEWDLQAYMVSQSVTVVDAANGGWEMWWVDPGTGGLRHWQDPPFEHAYRRPSWSSIGPRA